MRIHIVKKADAGKNWAAGYRDRVGVFHVMSWYKKRGDAVRQVNFLNERAERHERLLRGDNRSAPLAQRQQEAT